MDVDFLLGLVTIDPTVGMVVEYEVTLKTDVWDGPLGRGRSQVTSPKILEAVENLRQLVVDDLRKNTGLSALEEVPLSLSLGGGEGDEEDPL